MRSRMNQNQNLNEKRGNMKKRKSKKIQSLFIMLTLPLMVAALGVRFGGRDGQRSDHWKIGERA